LLGHLLVGGKVGFISTVSPSVFRPYLFKIGIVVRFTLGAGAFRVSGAFLRFFSCVAWIASPAVPLDAVFEQVTLSPDPFFATLRAKVDFFGLLWIRFGYFNHVEFVVEVRTPGSLQ